MTLFYKARSESAVCKQVRVFVLLFFVSFPAFVAYFRVAGSLACSPARLLARALKTSLLVDQKKAPAEAAEKNKKMKR